MKVSLNGQYQNRFLKEVCTVEARLMKLGVIMYVMKGLEKFVNKMEQPADLLG